MLQPLNHYRLDFVKSAIPYDIIRKRGRLNRTLHCCFGAGNPFNVNCAESILSFTSKIFLSTLCCGLIAPHSS